MATKSREPDDVVPHRRFRRSVLIRHRLGQQVLVYFGECVLIQARRSRHNPPRTSTQNTGLKCFPVFRTSRNRFPCNRCHGSPHLSRFSNSWLAKQRWIIERDYQELKQELGSGYFKGRGWRGVHHRATLSIDAYGFLVAERNRIPHRSAPGISGYQSRK